MLKSDELGFIGQHKKNDPSYLDFGDSSNRTAIYQYFSGRFVAPLQMLVDSKGLCSRHIKPPWNHKKNFSRDQLM